MVASTGPRMFEFLLKNKMTSTAIRRGEYVVEKVPGSVKVRVMLGPKRASTKDGDKEDNDERNNSTSVVATIVNCRDNRREKDVTIMKEKKKM